jgi:hypothetical protein
MGGQQESGHSDSRVFGGAVPPVKPCDAGAFLYAHPHGLTDTALPSGGQSKLNPLRTRANHGLYVRTYLSNLESPAHTGKPLPAIT